MSDEVRKKLTKADILQGRSRVEHVYFEALGGELPLRPLTDGQYSQVEAMKLQGLIVRGAQDKKGQTKMEDLQIDVGQQQRQDFDADALAVSYAIADGETWSVDEVKEFPAGTVRQIAQEVYRISGVEPETAQDLQSFRTK